MIHLYSADRALPLAGRVAGILEEPPADPMTPEWLAVPSDGMRRWLMLELARRLGAGGPGARRRRRRQHRPRLPGDPPELGAHGRPGRSRVRSLAHRPPGLAGAGRHPTGRRRPPTGCAQPAGTGCVPLRPGPPDGRPVRPLPPAPPGHGPAVGGRPGRRRIRAPVGRSRTVAAPALAAGPRARWASRAPPSGGPSCCNGWPSR